MGLELEYGLKWLYMKAQRPGDATKPRQGSDGGTFPQASNWPANAQDAVDSIAAEPASTLNRTSPSVGEQPWGPEARGTAIAADEFMLLRTDWSRMVCNRHKANQLEHQCLNGAFDDTLLNRVTWIYRTSTD